MIEVRLINDQTVVLNSELIELIEATPDTIISLTTGKKMIVRESVDEVVDKIVDFRRRVGIVVKDVTRAEDTPVQ